MKPELILHIGMGKTGTTALQEAFWANRKVLAQAGVTYPTLGAVSAAHHLITPFVPRALATSGWTFLKAQDWVPKLAASVAKAGTARVLMSSELIAWSETDAATQFCAQISKHFNLKICLYLRRQDNIIMAGYNQQIKAGNQSNPIDRVLGQMIDGYDFARTLTTWEAAAGAENLIVRPYERSQFPHGDLIADFFNGVLGMAVPKDFVYPAADNSNPRFSPLALEYKRLVNAVSKNAAASAPYTKALMAYSAAHDAAASVVFSEHALLTPEQRKHLLDHFADLNRQIAQKYLGRDVLFLDPLSADAVQANPVTVQDLTQVSDWLMQHDKHLATRLIEAAHLAREQRQVRVKRAANALLRSFGQEMVATPPPALAVIPKTAQLRRIILHPGLPKTGTTAIQEAFFKNRATLLRDHGILYPDLDENHTQPILSLFRKDVSANIRFAGMSSAQLAKYRTKAKAKLERDLHRGDWNTAVISGEGISTLKAGEWAEMLRWLQSFGGVRVDVVFALRDGLDLVRSSIQQNLKSGTLLEDLYAHPPQLRARQRLVPILAHLPKDQILIWDFDQARQADKGLLHHFCAQLGLSPQVCDLIAATPVFRNESLTQAGVEAMAARNRAQAKPTSVSVAEQLHFLSLQGPKFTLPDGVVDLVKDAVSDDAAWVAETFPVDGRHPLQPISGWMPQAAPKSAVMWSLVSQVRRKAEGLAVIAKLRVGVTVGRMIARFARARAVFSPTAKPRAPASQRHILVHFGIRKTGSSSIQQTLFDARKDLRDAAYVHGAIPNASLLLRNSFMSEDRLAKKKSSPNQDFTVARRTALGGLTLALNRAAARSDRLILSAEAISDFHDAELVAMFDVLLPFAGSATFIGYIRDPASYARSAFQETIKTALPSFWDRTMDFKFSYHEIVDRLDARFGAQNVKAFAFDRAIFPNGDVVQHFLEVAGVDHSKIEIARVNESLSLLGVKALYIYRKLTMPKDTTKALLRNRLTFVEALQGLTGPAFTLHGDLEAQIEARNQHIFDWAERRLGRALPRATGKGTGGVREEADLMQLSDQELAQFVDFASRYGISHTTGKDDLMAIAETIQRIRAKIS